MLESAGRNKASYCEELELGGLPSIAEKRLHLGMLLGGVSCRPRGMNKEHLPKGEVKKKPSAGADGRGSETLDSLELLKLLELLGATSSHSFHQFREPRRSMFFDQFKKLFLPVLRKRLINRRLDVDDGR